MFNVMGLCRMCTSEVNAPGCKNAVNLAQIAVYVRSFSVVLSLRHSRHLYIRGQICKRQHFRNASMFVLRAQFKQLVLFEALKDEMMLFLDQLVHLGAAAVKCW